MVHFNGVATDLVGAYLSFVNPVNIYAGQNNSDAAIGVTSPGQIVRIFTYMPNVSAYGFKYDNDCYQLYNFDGSEPSGRPMFIRLSDLANNLDTLSTDPTTVTADQAATIDAAYNATYNADGTLKNTGLFGFPSLDWSNWYWYLLGAVAGIFALDKLIEKL